VSDLVLYGAASLVVVLVLVLAVDAVQPPSPSTDSPEPVA
jgi:hypothetical protein